MIATLIRKDLQRLRVNWRSYAVLLAMPICITGLIGAVFGPAARNGEVPRIKLALVNEDENLIGSLLTSVLSGDQAAEYLETTIATRDEAMQQINGNQISAVIIVPKEFTTHFLAGEKSPSIELVKNPAQSYMPAITEELLRVVTELLNAVSQNLLADMPELVEMFEEDRAPDSVQTAAIVTKIGRRFERSEDYLFPPIIGMETLEEQQEAGDEPSSGAGFNVFAFVMPGLAAMFLLFTADGTTRDLMVERRNKTLDRYRTMNTSLMSFFMAKSTYSLVIVLASATIILVGGGLVFGITWKHIFPLSVLTIAYSVFCVGFAYMVIALIYRERLASVLNTVFIMMMAFLGGSMLPTQNLPGPIRDTIAPCMPNHAFAEAIKRLQFDAPGPHWVSSSLWLLACGASMLIAAIYLYRYRMLRGDPQ